MATAGASGTSRTTTAGMARAELGMTSDTAGARLLTGRVVLGLTAGVFAGVAIGCIVRPAELLGTVEVGVHTATARAEIVAMYGGLELGLAAFLALAAVRADWVKLGLVAATLILAGLGSARLAAALLVAGAVKPVIFVYAATEIVGAGLCAWSARRLPAARSPLWF